MDAVNVILAIANIGCALLFIGLSVPLVRQCVRQCVRMNHVYGVRFKKSFTSDKAWYDINAYGGKQLILWSSTLFVVAVATLFVDVSDNPVLALLIGTAPAHAALGSTWQTWKYVQAYD